MSVSEHVVEVYVPYTVAYVPKGCRNARTETFATSTSAIIRAPEPSEAQIAFWLNSCKLNRPHIPQTGRHEIVLYDGCFWWPFNPRNDQRSPYRDVGEQRPIEENFTADELLTTLRTKGRDPLGLETEHYWGRQIYGRGRRPDEVRELQEDGRELQIAMAQRRMSHLMIWNGRAYAKGGEPVYFQHCLGSPGCSDECMASIGADRSIEPTAGGLPSDIGRNEYAQSAFARGWFQRADQYGLAKSRRSDVSKYVSRVADYIEVVMPETIKLNPQEVRLDALFRAVCRGLLKSIDPRLERLRQTFVEVGHEYLRPTEVSRARYSALMEFQGRMDRDDLFRCAGEKLRDAYENVCEFAATMEASGGNFTLSEEDDWALGTLVGS